VRCGDIIHMGILLQKDFVTAAQQPSEEGKQQPGTRPALPAKEAACSLSGEKASFQPAIVLAHFP